jgi:hypothetical protein
MGISAGPKITTDGLVLHIDSSNTKSYSGSGITIYNMVTGGIAGTLVNGPVSDIAYKKTFILDGTNDNIQMQLPSGIVTGSQISISLWAKWKSTGTTTATIQTLVDNQYQVADNIGFFIQDRPDLGSVLEWTTQPNNAINRRVYSTQIVGDGSWHHIVGTNDGTYSRLYVDGYETGTAKTSAGIATTQDILCIGNWAYVYSSPRYLNGSVSNFKVYNRALSSTEILNDYFSTKNRFFPNENIVKNGLVLNIDASKSNSYPGAGNTIYDLSGSGNTGTFVNGPTFSTSNGGSLFFDNVNDYISFGTASSVKPTQLTLACFFKINAINAPNVIVGKQGTGVGAASYALVVQSGQLHFRISNSSGTEYNASTAFSNTSSYNYAVGTYDGSNLRLYLNGASVGSSSVSISIVYSDSYPLLMGYYANAFATNMSIGSLKLYNRALSATEVMQNFNAMRERYNL